MKATFLFAGAVLLSCSSTFTSQRCASDGDCPSQYLCTSSANGSFCGDPSGATLRIGMSAPATGPSQELGLEMKKGIELAFDEQNQKGGVRRRKVVLEFRDDSYLPELAEASTRELLDVQALPNVAARCPTTTKSVVDGQTPISDGALSRGPNAVIGMLGNVGTPTMVRSAPVTVETGSLFFGAFTGSGKMLRDGLAGPCAKYVFNVRASYAQEARATLEYFLRLGVRDYKHLVSFDQNDTFGQAGYDGLVRAYTDVKGDLPAEAIKRVRYTRDDPTSVPAQVAEVGRHLASMLAQDTAPHTVGILMTDTYGAALKFITGLRDWQYADDAEQASLKKASRLTFYFSNVSFVGPNSLATRLTGAGMYTTPSGTKSYTEGVFVSQVVPNYEGDSSDGVKNYLGLIEAKGLKPSFTSLEGYLAARVFLAGLSTHQGALTSEELVRTFEKLPPLNLGFGSTAGFSSSNHGYSRSVWGTSISAEGRFENRYFWSDSSPIQIYE